MDGATRGGVGMRGVALGLFTRVSCRVYLRPIDNDEHILDARRLPVATFPHLVIFVIEAVVRTARVRAAYGRAAVAVVTVDRALLREGGVARNQRIELMVVVVPTLVDGWGLSHRRGCGS